MRLSKPTTNAVKVLVHLARHPDETISVPMLAQACEMPETITFKLVPLLVREGFAQTDRGRAGGVRLGRPADAISLGEIVRALEKAPLETRGDITAPVSDLPLIVDEAFDGFLGILDQHSIADLARPKSAGSFKKPALKPVQ